MTHSFARSYTHAEVVQAAGDAVALFIEYRDVHGYSEAEARVQAIAEVYEGTSPATYADMHLGPEFRDHAARVLEERGASPFEAARFFRLPEAAQLAAVGFLKDPSIPVRDLLATIEERSK